MLETRVIPCLLYDDGGLVKTVKFKKANYIGDPINAIKIFNDKEVDELILIDITASERKRGPNINFIRDVASECFMPLCYGGGVNSVDLIREILSIGVEKVSINRMLMANPELVREASKRFGSQALVASIDAKKNLFGNYKVCINRASKSLNYSPVDYARMVEDLGCGEILLTSVDREGSWEGFDLELIKSVSEAVSIPVIANGGAGKIQDLIEVKKNSDVSALAIGSMAVYQKKGMGVLINFPNRELLDEAFNDGNFEIATDRLQR